MRVARSSVEVLIPWYGGWGSLQKGKIHERSTMFVK